MKVKAVRLVFPIAAGCVSVACNRGATRDAMKIAILGGGGFRVPMVYGALLARASASGSSRSLSTTSTSGGSPRSRPC